MSEDYEGISSLLKGMFSSPEARRSMSANQRAAYVWHNVNGDVERAHTTGVFLKEPHVKGADPILGVYVDSRMRAVDFRANREVYRARLSMGGLEVSEIEFIVSQYGHGAAPRKEHVSGAAAAATPKTPLPDNFRVDSVIFRYQNPPAGEYILLFRIRTGISQRERLQGHEPVI